MGASGIRSRFTPNFRTYREPSQWGNVSRRWVYEAYRDVEGRMVPHRLAWMMTYSEVGPLQETAAYTITSYRFDVPIDPKVFKK